MCGGRVESRLIERDAGLQPHDDFQPLGVPGRGPVRAGPRREEVSGNPDVHASELGSREPWRRDANDLEWLVTEGDRSPGHVIAPGEPLHPRAVADHRDAHGGVGRVFLFGEKPSPLRPHAEQLEEASRRVAGAHLPRVGALADHDVVDRVRRDMLEGRGAAAHDVVRDVAEAVGREHVHARRLFGEVQPHDPIGVPNVSRPPQEQPVGNPEHRGIRADAQRKRDGDEQGERGLAAKTARREPDIAQQGIHGHLPWACLEPRVGSQLGTQRNRGQDGVGDRPRGLPG